MIRRWDERDQNPRAGDVTIDEQFRVLIYNGGGWYVVNRLDTLTEARNLAGILHNAVDRAESEAQEEVTDNDSLIFREARGQAVLRLATIRRELSALFDQGGGTFLWPEAVQLVVGFQPTGPGDLGRRCVEYVLGEQLQGLTTSLTGKTTEQLDRMWDLSPHEKGGKCDYGADRCWRDKAENLLRVMRGQIREGLIPGTWAFYAEDTINELLGPDQEGGSDAAESNEGAGVYPGQVDGTEAGPSD